jgi:hypothetical protein
VDLYEVSGHLFALPNLHDTISVSTELNGTSGMPDFRQSEPCSSHYDYYYYG